MFARIAGRYDLANRLLSGGIDHWWRRRLVRAVRAAGPQRILDLATGSGAVAFALADIIPNPIKIIGMDFCQPMLDEAIRKRDQRPGYAGIAFQPGDGLALPLPDAAVDAVTISFGLRNMADRHRALSEMRRVLRPGGRVFVLEFSQPVAWFRPIYYIYLKWLLPEVARLVTGDRGAYEYLGGSIESFPGRLAMSAELERAGLRVVRAEPLTFGIVALHEAVAGAPSRLS